MRKALPTITEDLGTLKQRLQHEHDGRKKPRLQMLCLLASGQAHTRQAVAQLLGVHRNTIGHWLGLYESGGLDALLALYVPAGKPVSLPPDVLAALEQVLRQPYVVQGFRCQLPLSTPIYAPEPPEDLVSRVQVLCHGKLQIGGWFLIDGLHPEIRRLPW